MSNVATNLRLTERTAEALRQRAAATGRSQQDLLREAVDRYLGVDDSQSDRERALADGSVTIPTPYRRVEPTITLANGVTTLELLDRDDR